MVREKTPQKQISPICSQLFDFPTTIFAHDSGSVGNRLGEQNICKLTRVWHNSLLDNRARQSTATWFRQVDIIMIKRRIASFLDKWLEIFILNMTNSLQCFCYFRWNADYEIFSFYKTNVIDVHCGSTFK